MKAGIVTHYYHSNNYGGNLQAYALCRVLNDMGVEAEQISFLRNYTVKRNLTIKGFFRFLYRFVTKICNYPLRHNLDVRNASIAWFNQSMIPHSKMVFDKDSISRSVEDYDVFVTGSDQVWHPAAYCPAYGLDFVPSDRLKISYAASIASDSVSREHLETLGRYLADFDGISVREERAAELMKDFVDKPVEVSLDPTLLLHREDWDAVCSDFVCEKPYVFCYFLGDSSHHRRLAEEYAARHHLRVVTIPYLLGNYRYCDRKFGDEKLYDVSPADFIALIKHADAVLTDSFHAAVFSVIYEKSFAVFDRAIGSSMGSRLTSFMDLVGLQERFCNTPEKSTVEYIEALPSVSCDYAKAAIEKRRISSIRYLKRCIFGDEFKGEPN